MSCCNNNSSNQDGMLIVNKAREAAACAEANCASSFTNATNAATSATNAANSAAAAAASETNVENLWEDFQERYMGPYATPPVAISEGSLYYNTTSNVLFVWNGSAWVSTDFNEFTNFTATGTTTARNLVTRFADVVNVKDFGADPTGISDSTSAIQSAISSGGATYIPKGVYLISANITIPSNCLIFGDGAASVLKASANGLNMLSTGFGVTAKENIFIRDLQIDGGGQTTNIYTGLRQNIGIYATRVSNLKIDNVVVKNMGIINQANPVDDATWGGFGIFVTARFGNTTNIVISNCTVTRVAGAGMNSGDGINIDAFSNSVAVSQMGVVVRDCYVSTCGRHCYTVAGGAGQSIPEGVAFVNCYAEKSGSDGIDIETGYEVLIDGCTFRNCGNDQTYTDPVAIYGPTYRLLAAIATDNEARLITITACVFDSCYYGVTYGATDGLRISDCTFYNSTTSDLDQILSSGATNFQVSNSLFASVKNTLNYYSVATGPLQVKFDGCVFWGTVIASALKNAIFANCAFRKGFHATGNAGEFSFNTFDSCTFSDWAGAGINMTNANAASADCVVSSCTFQGGGNQTYGIQFGVNSAIGWKITDCNFYGLTQAGIGAATGVSTSRPVQIISNNLFDACANGINFELDFNDCIIDGNLFASITGWAISIQAINGFVSNITLVNNMTKFNAANGFRLTVTTGTLDYCIATSNNVHIATGTKWSVTVGANGVSANNITT